MKVELTPPHYFKQNPYLMQLNKWFTQNVRSFFIQGLDVVTTTLLEFSTNQKATMLQLFENIKNQYVGQPHKPHSALIEKGIHALTMKGVSDSK